MVRKTTTIMTALGLALTVAVLVSILALVHGVNTSLASSGHPLQVLVLRKGSDSELSSNFNRTAYQDLKFKAGIARGRSGEPLASLELVTIINLPRANGDDANINVRGLMPQGVEMRDMVKIAEGRWFETGKREVVVGNAIAAGYPSAQLGRTLRFGRGDWTIVGVMDAGRTAYNSEVWADVNQVAADYQRTEVLSSSMIRATDEVAAQALINDLNNDQRLNVGAMTEKEYYERQTVAAAPVQYIGIFISLIMAVGSAFAAMNTMYAAVARRAREIGTLRVLGFSRASILLSFTAESLLLSLLGGVLGCLLVLPLNGITADLGNFVTFSEMAFDFQITPAIMASGIVFAAVLGAVGGLFPAGSAARKQILTALRGA
jgi:putative ABC transport system permease protein